MMIVDSVVAFLLRIGDDLLCANVLGSGPPGLRSSLGSVIFVVLVSRFDRGCIGVI